MSSLGGNDLQVGISATATQNCTLSANSDGTFTLARGNVGATTADILTIDANDVVTIVGNNNVVQIVNTQDGAVATGTTLMPHDDTIPQNTEGDEYMTLTITPKNTSNILKIDVIGHFAANTNQVMTGALFQDTTAGALAGTSGFPSASFSRSAPFVFTHYMIAGTISATTFKFRFGIEASGTITFNGYASARALGGVYASSITITEYTP